MQITQKEFGSDFLTLLERKGSIAYTIHQFRQRSDKFIALYLVANGFVADYNSADIFVEVYRNKMKP